MPHSQAIGFSSLQYMYIATILIASEEQLKHTLSLYCIRLKVLFIII